MAHEQNVNESRGAAYMPPPPCPFEVERWRRISYRPPPPCPMEVAHEILLNFIGDFLVEYYRRMAKGQRLTILQALQAIPDDHEASFLKAWAPVAARRGV